MTARRGLLVFLPLLVVAGLATLFAVALLSDRDASELPSPLVGRPMPQTPLPALEGRKAFPARIEGPALVNFFASWCAPCRAEHPVLTALAREMPVHGVSYRDAPAASAGFLRELGDPYSSVGLDPDARAAFEWGVTAIPETFLVDRDGVVRHVVRGPIDAKEYERLLAAIGALAPR